MGLYTSAVGMLDQFNVENNISGNLANMQTPGYKERTPVQENFSNLLTNSQEQFASWASGGIGTAQVETPIGRFGQAPQLVNYGLNLAQGSPRYTGSPLDLMVVGNAFFTARAGNQTLLTRNGSLHRSAQGVLTTAQGYPLVSSNGGSLKVPAGVMTVDQSGGVQVDGKPIGRLALARVPVGQPLTDAGNGYYQGKSQPLPVGTPSTGVLQGYLESSNVDLSTQMSAMLSAQRSYQANSRLLQMQDDTMSLTVNDLGRVNG